MNFASSYCPALQIQGAQIRQIDLQRENINVRGADEQKRDADKKREGAMLCRLQPPNYRRLP